MDSAAALTGYESSAPKGCMLTLSSIDRDEHAELCEAVRTARGAVLERLEARFARAVADGEIDPETDLHALARFVQTVQNGMSILARDGAARADLEAVARMAMASWDATVRSAA
jgi:AcrR family transcriptional regulator